MKMANDAPAPSKDANSEVPQENNNNVTSSSSEKGTTTTILDKYDNEAKSSTEPKAKRTKKEWLVFKGAKHTRVGDDFQVSALPEPSGRISNNSNDNNPRQQQQQPQEQPPNLEEDKEENSSS
jgi:hypothetical protein